MNCGDIWIKTDVGEKYSSSIMPNNPPTIPQHESKTITFSFHIPEDKILKTFYFSIVHPDIMEEKIFSAKIPRS